MWDPASAESHTALTYAPVQMRASTSDGRNAVRIPCVDPLLAHEGHDQAGEHAARPDGIRKKANGFASLSSQSNVAK